MISVKMEKKVPQKIFDTKIADQNKIIEKTVEYVYKIEKLLSDGEVIIKTNFDMKKK
jgi:hypothetical protein